MSPAQSLKKLSLLAVLIGIVSLASVSPALAQNTMSAIPTRVDLIADPGQTVTAEVKIRNDSSISQTFSINIDDFIVYDSIGTPIPVQSSLGNRWSLKSWITAPKIIPVDPNGIQVIKLTFKVPLTALPGGHYAMITYQPNPDLKKGEQRQTANLIGQRVGTLLYLTISGPINQNASMTKFTTERFVERGPVVFSGSVLNLSDVHVAPTGTISIFGPLNNKVAEIPVEVGNVFPEVTRDFTAEWDQRWGYGRYRADLSLAYGTAGGILTSTIFFWLFPIRLVIYILILIVSVLMVIILLNKKGRKHQEELEREVTELKRELEEIEEKK